MIRFHWKQILDGYSCTECGRCTSVCPANTVGKSLSPREIIVDIRKRTKDKAPLLVEGKTEGEVFEKTLVHDYITDTGSLGMYNLYGLCSGMSCYD